MREYSGNGILKVDEVGSFESRYVLRFQNDGKAVIDFDFSIFNPQSHVLVNKFNDEKIIVGNFNGKLDNSSGTLEISKVVIGGFHSNFEYGKPFKETLILQVFDLILLKFSVIDRDEDVEIKYGLSNFEFFGNFITKKGNEFKRNLRKVNIEGDEISFIQIDDYEEVIKSLKERLNAQVTSELIIKNKYNYLKMIDKKVHDILTLCSFAMGNFVTDIYQDIYVNGELRESILKPLKTHPFNTRISVIDTWITGDNEFEQFLILSYPQYIKYKEILGLDIVIEYYITSKRNALMEINYLLGSITFECLESYLSEYFKSKNVTKNLNGFKNKTRSLFEEFGITYDENELKFIKIRDKIVHTGRFPDYQNSVNDYNKLINLIDRTLLTIFNYKEKPYHNMKTNKKEILN